MNTLFLFAALLQDQGSTLERIEREVSAVVERARKSVVTVRVELSSGQRCLSGIIFTEDGHLLSDGSGFARALTIRVALPDGRDRTATIVGVDKWTNVGVLKVDAAGLIPADLADAAPAQPGLHAIVVATSTGTRPSAEVGYVAALGRAIQVGGRRFEDMIQLTTRVHPGNSGGFVADARGRLMGMVHSVLMSDDGDGVPGELARGLPPEVADLLTIRGQRASFVVPAPQVRWVAQRIIRNGRMVRGWMGVTVKPIDEAVRAQLSLPADEGAEVWSVDAEGPSAGVLRRRDVLLRLGGRPTADVVAIKRWIEEQERPSTVPVVFLRSGARQEGSITLKVVE